MKILLNSRQIEKILTDITEKIVADIPKDDEIAVIGIRSRGDFIAQRIAKMISESKKCEIPCGTLDITLYRDDLNSPWRNAQPVIRATEIDFDINDKIVILVDDVLYTGRSTRAALDALIDLGRPKAIRLAVLVERDGREYPIQADYIGLKADITEDETIEVNLTESDGKDEVVVK